jgi:hypothetical protein
VTEVALALGLGKPERRGNHDASWLRAGLDRDDLHVSISGPHRALEPVSAGEGAWSPAQGTAV